MNCFKVMRILDVGESACIPMLDKQKAQDIAARIAATKRYSEDLRDKRFSTERGVFVSVGMESEIFLKITRII